MSPSQGGEKYQQAFYVFEELAQAPATSSIVTLVSQAVSELHLGRVEEAQVALEQALQKQPGYADAIANLLILNVITGKDATELTRYAGIDHCLLFTVHTPFYPPNHLRGSHSWKAFH